MQINNQPAINKTMSQNNRNRVAFGAAPIPNEVFDLFIKKIEKADSIDIFGHRNADPDCFNSAVALAEILTKLGKKVRILLEKKTLKEAELYKDKFEIIDPIDRPDLKPADLGFVVDLISKTRLTTSGLEYFDKFSPNNVIGLDHHRIEDSVISKLVYRDAHSKSTSELVYDFVKRIKNVELSTDGLKLLYHGALDDIKKSDHIILSKFGNKSFWIENKDKPIAQETLNVLYSIEKDLTRKSILRLDNKTYTFKKGQIVDISRLTSSQKRQRMSNEIQKVIKELDILSNLTTEEQIFRKKLFNAVKITNNGRLAYVIINPNNKFWKKIGQDNEVTSNILRDLRLRMLENKPDDEFIPKQLHSKLERNRNKLKGVVVFYRGPLKENKHNEEIYKMSIHSKDNYAGIITSYVNNNYGYNAGGHETRAGGNIPVQYWKDYIDAVFAANNYYEKPNPFKFILNLKDKLAGLLPDLSNTNKNDLNL